MRRVTLRYHSLEEALLQFDAGALPNGCRIVVSWGWWDTLSDTERDSYRTRCEVRGVRLSTDHQISRHFVEINGSDAPPLSTEHGA